MRIIRVFPRRTSLTPADSMAFIGDPPLERPEADEVHVSCVFTWDIPKAERLSQAWAQYYPMVKLGGPAFESVVNGFTPGLYLRHGVTITTRGCNNHCSFCLVPEREGKLKLIDDFTEGNIIQDNNILQAPQAHIERVCQMLKSQHDIQFSGGLEAARVTPWFVDQIRGLSIGQLFLACDNRAAIHPLRRALAMLTPYFKRKKLRCYVLIGLSETPEQATERLEEVWGAGAMPFAQLYQPADRWIEYGHEWKALHRTWSQPAAMRSLHK